MNRLPALGYRWPIQHALRGIPGGLDDLLRCDFFCGVDPVFADLHRDEMTTDGRSYRDTAAVVCEHNQMHRPRASRTVTVALPTVPHPMTAIHELGHVLHARLGWRHIAEPVTAYAAVDQFEAFAEAFTAWCQPHYAKRPDPMTVDYLDRLTAGELR